MIELLCIRIQSGVLMIVAECCVVMLSERMFSYPNWFAWKTKFSSCRIVYKVNAQCLW